MSEQQGFLLIIVLILLLLAVVIIFLLIWQLRKTRKISVEKEKVLSWESMKSEELILNILPVFIAEELKEKGKVAARRHEQVSILFTDFKNFSKLTREFTAADLVKEIDHIFRAFDFILSQYLTVEKIKTIGDAYMAASGLSLNQNKGTKDLVRAALEMNEFMREYIADRMYKNQPYFEMRIGIHTGSVVAGVVGMRKFAYDIWGDAVNVAARMESEGEVHKINISNTTYELIKNEKEFAFEYRGALTVKNMGEIAMYFVEKPHY